MPVPYLFGYRQKDERIVFCKGKTRSPLLPVQRGRVTVKNITFINALPYICENGCKWRRLPKEYGNRHVIYKCFSRWVRDGIIERLFRELHANGTVQTARSVLMPGSMTVLVHLDACGTLKKPAGRRQAVSKAAWHAKST